MTAPERDPRADARLPALQPAAATDSLAFSLRAHTSARVGLRRAGASLATQEILDFQLAHAQARDAVHAALDIPSFVSRLQEQVGSLLPGLNVITLASAAPDRATYLRRPHLGRQLAPESVARLTPVSCDVVFLVADGLSAVAVHRHAIPLLSIVLPRLAGDGWHCGPVCVAAQARVAIGDPIGAALNSQLSVILIGERPGLSAADSLGIYITWAPRPGRNDAERNCISNVRDGGLKYEEAAARLLWYLNQARAQQQTGTSLKEQDLAGLL